MNLISIPQPSPGGHPNIPNMNVSYITYKSNNHNLELTL